MIELHKRYFYLDSVIVRKVYLWTYQAFKVCFYVKDNFRLLAGFVIYNGFYAGMDMHCIILTIVHRIKAQV